LSEIFARLDSFRQLNCEIVLSDSNSYSGMSANVRKSVNYSQNDSRSFNVIDKDVI